MDEISKQRARLQTLVRQGRVPKRQLAIRAGVSVTGLTGMERPDWDPRASTLAALVRAANAMGFPRRPRGRSENRAAA